MNVSYLSSYGKIRSTLKHSQSLNPFIGRISVKEDPSQNIYDHSPVFVAICFSNRLVIGIGLNLR